MLSLTPEQIQDLIDAKQQLLADVIAKLSDLIANPKVSYSIDGQSVSWSDYMRWLKDLQNDEIKALNELVTLQNRVEPFQFQSRIL